MAERDNDADERLYHGHEHAHATAHHHEPGTMDTSEQEKVFAAFIRWSAWTVVLIFLILAFLALTQT